MFLENLVVALGWELKGEVDLKRFEASLIRLRTTLGTLGKGASLARASLAGFAGGFGYGVVDETLRTVGRALAAIPVGAIKASAEIETLGVSLKALEGSQEAGQKALEWITNFADESPVLGLKETAEAYRDLKNFGLDPTNGTLLALVDTMAKTGKGTESLSRITTGLGQAWMKGKLQSEEMNQLIDAGVPAWAELEKAVGKNVDQLQELAKKGQLGRREIDLLIRQMGRSAQGASADMARTFDSMTSRLGERWTGFQRKIGQAGFFKFIENELAGLHRVIDQLEKDGRLDRWAAAISANMTTFLTNVGDLATGISNKIAIIPQGVRAAFSSFNDAFANTRRELDALDAFFSGELDFGANMIREINSISLEFDRFRQNIVNLISYLQGIDLSAAGAAMMASLKNGIDAGGAAVVAAAQAIGNSIRSVFEGMQFTPTISPKLEGQTAPSAQHNAGDRFKQGPRGGDPAPVPLRGNETGPATPGLKRGASLRMPSNDVRGLRPAGTQVANAVTNVGGITVNIAGNAKESDVRRGVAQGLRDAGSNPTRNLFFNVDSPVTA